MLNAFTLVCWLIKKAFAVWVLITEHYDTPQGSTRKHLLLHFFQMAIMVNICFPAFLGLCVVSLVVVRKMSLTCCHLLQEQGGFCIRILCFLSNKTSVFQNSCFQFHSCPAVISQQEIWSMMTFT